MELYLDILDVVVVKVLLCIFLLVGVIINLSIIVVGKKLLDVVFLEFYEVMGGQGCLFVQVMVIIVEGMVNDVFKLCFIIVDIVVKVLVIVEGLVVIKMLKAEGIMMLGIVVYGVV